MLWASSADAQTLEIVGIVPNGCPDAEALQPLVAARLGYDPMGADNVLGVRVEFERHLERLGVRIELSDRGVIRGERTIESFDPTCRELSDALVLALCIAFDPVMARAPAPPEPSPSVAALPEPPPESSAPLEVPSSLPDSRVEAAREAPRARIAGTLGLVLGTGPAPTGGLALSGGFEWDSFSLDIEARGELAAQGSSEVGRFSTFLISFAAVPCARLSIASVCGVVRGGPLRSIRDEPGARDVTTVFLALGLRSGVEIELLPFVRLALWGEIDGVLTQTELTIGARRVYSSLPVSGTLSAGIVWLP